MIFTLQAGRGLYCVPHLNDKELQDSYKVMGADALLKTMLTPANMPNT